MDVSGPLSTQPNTPSKEQARIEQLREASEKLEAGFLAEMLKASGLGKTPDTFGGGTGEDQFTSFLVQAHAEKLVEAGGIGLAEHIFQALVERE
ncbi:rod-binding protein [Celeribacter sp.]|uniref:rod-binding protein n=1 Tax=Celeribacter sp. TaxID=1890673 RepID=UPI003A918278